MSSVTVVVAHILIQLCRRQMSNMYMHLLPNDLSPDFRKMLPPSAARHLLRHPGKPYVQPFEHVAIFFSDIVGYTRYAEV
jgi:class 3 adenylate cyclase